jgi:hypothetical protein
MFTTADLSRSYTSTTWSRRLSGVTARSLAFTSGGGSENAGPERGQPDGGGREGGRREQPEPREPKN